MYIRSESLTVTSFHYLFLHYKLYTEKKEDEKREKCKGQTLTPASPADRACRKALRSSCSAREFIGVLEKVGAVLESDGEKN